MFGSLFYNCWGALIAFAIYFFATFQTAAPSKVLIGSFIAALTCFFAMFLTRYVIGYITYSPNDEIIERIEKDKGQLINENKQGEIEKEATPTSTIEFKDESAEEIAKVVRTMLTEDDTATSNT